MFFSIVPAFFVAALVPQAIATLYVTSPVASTVCTAGKACIVSWNDNGNSPSLAQIGVCTLALYVGSVIEQLQLQPLGSVDVSKQATYSFVPIANIGADSSSYFIRFTSTNLTVTSPQPGPWLGFSSKFTLTGMTGTFNSTVLSYISAATAVGGTTTPASSVPASTSSVVSNTTSKPTTPTSSKPAATTSSQSAGVPAFGSSSPAAALAAVIVSAFFAAGAF